MSEPSLSQNIEQRQSFDLYDVLQDSVLSGKLEVQWNSYIYTKLQALNEELSSMGLEQYLQNSESHPLIINFNTLISSFYKLFEHHMRSLSSRDDVNDAVHRLKADLEYSRIMHQRCKEDLKIAQNSLKQAREHERRIEAEKTALSSQIRSLKESARRQQSDFQMRDAQFQHELQRLQKENSSLKTRINVLLQKTSSSTRRPVVATQEPTENIRSQLDLTRYMLDHLRTRENELFYENRELRDIVSVLSTRIRCFTQQLRSKRMRLFADRGDFEVPQELGPEETSLDGSTDMEEAETSSDSSDEENLASDRCGRRKSANVHHLLLEMPFHMVRDRLTRRVHRLSRHLWKEIKAVNDGHPLWNVGDLRTKREFEGKLIENVIELAKREEQSEKRDGLLAGLSSLTAGGDMFSTRDGDEVDRAKSTPSEGGRPNEESPNPDDGEYTIKTGFTPTPRRFGRRK